ncbi:MAG: ATP-binding protein [Bacteroidota bacterium]
MSSAPTIDQVPAGKISILVVEDSRSQAAELSQLLSRNAYRATWAENGLLATNELNQSRFDLIISDVIMPEMDGYELCKWVKSREEYRSIPFMLLTSLSDPDDILKGLQCGADSFLTKPYNEQFLRQKISYLLDNFNFRRQHKDNDEPKILLGGKVHNISSERMQIIDLLLSTYENAVIKSNELATVNRELTLAQARLRILNENLEKMVAQRTKRLAESEISYRTIFESAARLILSMDHNGIITDCNNKVRTTLGYSNDELIGQNISILFPDLAEPEIFSTGGSANTEQESEDAEYTFRKKDGTSIEVSVNKSMIPGMINGDPLIIWIVEDISERKTWERKLIEAKEKAEEADRLKTAFLSNLSHEIRTPLNAISGFSSCLNQAELSRDDTRMITGELNSASERLLLIMDDILDMSMIISGQMTMQLEQASLNMIIYDLITHFKNNPPDPAIQFTCSLVNPDEDRIILTDKAKVDRILKLLLDNAFKFTTYGTVNLSWITRDEFVEFRVEDTGIGIPPEYSERIFEPFYQIDGSASRKFEGNGLGLAIARSLAEMLESKISVKSTAGKGSVFTFTLLVKDVKNT